MNLFKGKIRCMNCGKNYNYKSQRNTEVYVCQTRKNYGSKICDSKTIIMEDILLMIKKHCELFDIDFNKSSCSELVSEILIEKNGDMIIKYTDNNIGRYVNGKIVF